MPGTTDLFFIFILALLLFGPDKMPELVRLIGRGIREVRKASTEFKRQLNIFDDDTLR